jgi:hypothetical protein
MLNVSTGGASFLVAADESPQVGQRLRLAEMFSQNRTVREANLPLPRLARVLRVDDEGGVTRRVAVRYKVGAEVKDSSPLARRFAAGCSSALYRKVPPPALVSATVAPGFAAPVGGLG